MKLLMMSTGKYRGSEITNHSLAEHVKQRVPSHTPIHPPPHPTPPIDLSSVL